MATGQSGGDQVGAPSPSTPTVSQGSALIDTIKEVVLQTLKAHNIGTPVKSKHHYHRHNKRCTRSPSSGEESEFSKASSSKRQKRADKKHGKRHKRSRSKSGSPEDSDSALSVSKASSRVDPVSRARDRYWQEESVSSASGSEGDDDEEDVKLSGEEDEGEGKPRKKDRLCPPDLYHRVMAKAAAAINLTVPSSNITPPAKTHWATEYRKNTVTHPVIPFPEAMEDIFQVEWEHIHRPKHYRGANHLYTLPQPVMQRLRVPKVDAPVVAVANATLLPTEGEQGPKDTVDRKIEAAFKKGFESAAHAFRASVAASTFSRAILVWADELVSSEKKLSTRGKSTIKKMALSAAAAADAVYDSVQFSARSMANSVSGRRQIWLRQWQGDSASTSRILSLPFKGEKLFGEELDPMLIEDAEKRKVLPSKKVLPKKQPFRGSTSGYRPRQGFQPNRQRWQKPKTSFKYRKPGHTSTNTSSKGKSDQQTA